MGTNECSQPASKSSWDSQDFGDVNMVLKMVHFHKSSRPQWVKATELSAASSARSRISWLHPCTQLASSYPDTEAQLASSSAIFTG